MVSGRDGLIRTVIVDDEPYARKGLLALLAKTDRFEVAGEAGSGREAVRVIRSLHPDLVFLDVQMPDLDGFQVLERLDTPFPQVVFVTAHDEYALRAFEVSAVDYLLKPLDEARFERCLQRVEDRIRADRGEPSPDVVDLLEAYRDALMEGRTRHLERLTVPTREGHRVLEVGQIDWIEAQDYYSALHVGPKTYLAKVSMSQLAAQLDPHRFIRVHRSTIVNLNAVETLETPPTGEHAVRLLNGTRRRVSRSGLRNLKQALEMLG
jgi:two-component system LytT family response regulator